MPVNKVDIDKLTKNECIFSFLLGGDQLPPQLGEKVSALFKGELVGLSARDLVPGKSIKFLVMHEAEYDRRVVFERLKRFARVENLAYAILPDMADVPEVKFAIMDMDSTLINEEVIEELASYAGVREHVAEVTRLAMEGKLDFHQALRERVKLLAGQSALIMQAVYEKHITPTPGLPEMIAGFKSLGIKSCVVSGGFISVVQPFAEKVGIDHAIANTLAVEDGKLTGEVLGEIVDSDVKKRTLLELCERYRCEPSQAIAIGDGANDLKMINTAGLGIAFCAKPIVQEQALCAINRRRLDDILMFLA